MKRHVFIILIVIVCLLSATTVALSVASFSIALKPLEYVEEQAPTCTEQGNLAHYRNPINGLVYSDEDGEHRLTREEIAVPALGHSLEHNDAESPNCTQDGHVEYWKCSACGKCFADGKGKTEILDIKDGESLGHTYNADKSHGEWKWTDDYLNAEFIYYCATCGQLQNVQTSVSVTEIASKCEENGLKSYTSTVNVGGKQYIDKIQIETPSLGHEYAQDFTIDRNPTCTEAGVKSKHCARCDAKDEITEIPKAEHVYKSNITNPTYTEQGYTTFSCKNCDYAYTANYVDAYLSFSLSEDDGHSYSVSGCNITESMSVIIPEAYKGCPVTAVSERAFANNTSITSIIIPDSITQIGLSAFNGCSSLVSATIPNSVTIIGDRAFYGCNSLASITYLGTQETWYTIDGLRNMTQYGESAKTLIIDGKTYTVCNLGIIDDTERFGGGCGAESHPYLISTKTHFENISNIDSKGKYFKLANSIDLGIWNEPFAFSGNLDGNKYEITYTQSLSGNIDFYGGLFTRLNSGSNVQNLKINAYIKKADHGSKNGFVGGLAGITSGEVNVSCVSVYGKISIGNYDGVNFVDGLFGGFVGGTVNECANFAQIENWGMHVFSGGIAGYAIASDASIKISNCYNTGNVLASSAYTAAYGWRSGGGIAGQVRGDNNNKLNFEYCYNDSVVKLEWTGVATGGFQGCGGIFGDIRDNNSNNIAVDLCYWNNAKMSTYGNNASFHKNNGRKDMTGAYDGWSADIWAFSNASAPALKWIQA